jgi:glutamate-1-semialdehyde aminotransferase
MHFTAKTPIKDARILAESDHERSRKLFGHLLDAGILILAPERLHGGFSYAHSESDAEHLTATVEGFVKGT